MSLRVILPGTGRELLRKELDLAFAKAGCEVFSAAPGELHVPENPGSLRELADAGRLLFFSVNFQGLEQLGAVLEILEDASAGKSEKSRARIAVWCVDNPWNLLAGVRDHKWRGLDIFVTDASFIEPLKAHGAERVFHLPLAASFEFFAPDATRNAAYPPPDDMAPFVFVGRPAFPGKDRFFAGSAVTDTLMREARAMLKDGQRPDLIWWEEHLLTAQTARWPGKEARSSVFGAEESNLCWRALCLKQAAVAGTRGDRPGLDVFGDSGWKGILPPKARLRQPVDYYTRLPGIYTSARYSLALTSLLLPQGLNQRHFDVWAAGGLCLSDNTPGLGLFPEELTRPITFRKPSDIADVAEKLERFYNRKDIKRDWRDHIKAHHTYDARVNSIFDCLGIS